jgi:large subunit ribosomal protein L21
MYAIIRDGGRQYKVEEGMELDVDYRDAAQGDKITFGEVLFVGGDSPTLGKPLVSGASVTGEVLGIEQGPKLVIQKFRRRKNERRRTGHRQMFTRVKIGKISV